MQHAYKYESHKTRRSLESSRVTTRLLVGIICFLECDFLLSCLEFVNPCYALVLWFSENSTNIGLSQPPWRHNYFTTSTPAAVLLPGSAVDHGRWTQLILLGSRDKDGSPIPSVTRNSCTLVIRLSTLALLPGFFPHSLMNLNLINIRPQEQPQIPMTKTSPSCRVRVVAKCHAAASPKGANLLVEGNSSCANHPRMVSSPA